MPQGEIALPTLGTVEVSTGRGSRDEPWLFYTFSSFAQPPTVYRYDFSQDSSQVFYAPPLAFDFSPYLTRQVFATSRDGTRIPLFLVHRRSLALDGNNPVLLYGYGGFNISMTPAFSASRLAWLERGGVLAVANLRGGGEYGEEWHQAGSLANKQNVFDDFIACAEYLIAGKITSPARLAIQGGSNGGLLVGAALMILARCCSVEQARRSIDWPLVIAIASSLVLGRAIETSGLAEPAARTIITLSNGAGPWGVLAGLYVATLILTELVTNNAAAAIAFPLAIVGGLVLAFMKMAKKLPPVRWVASAYVNVIRGTPLFLQIYVAFIGLPLQPEQDTNVVLVERQARARRQCPLRPRTPRCRFPAGACACWTGLPARNPWHGCWRGSARESRRS